MLYTFKTNNRIKNAHLCASVWPSLPFKLIGVKLKANLTGISKY